MAIKKIKLPDNTTVDINDSRLPAVTATDNGKVLSVSGGIWSANSKPSYTLDEVTDGSSRKLSDYQPLDADLTAIAGLSGTSGLLKKTAADTWSLDTNTYYHSGNANKSDVAWACSTLTATGNITPGANNTYTLGSDNRVWNVGYFRQAIYFNRNNVIYFTATTAGGYFAWRVNGESTNRMTLNSTTLSMTGDITATGTITPGSDSRIKDNQKDISSENAFFVIENLKPKTWVWNEKSNEKLNGKAAAGLVAQEVKEILPDAVTISENGDIKDFHSLNYNTIQGYEIAAIKGLIEEVKSLKTEIAELKKTN